MIKNARTVITSKRAGAVWDQEITHERLRGVNNVLIFKIDVIPRISFLQVY